jgi:hypothetical protein
MGGRARAARASPPALEHDSPLVTSTPHDALVRAIFGQPHYAEAEELRASEALGTLARLARHAFEVGEAPHTVIRSAFADALVPENRSTVQFDQ